MTSDRRYVISTQVATRLRNLANDFISAIDEVLAISYQDPPSEREAGPSLMSYMESRAYLEKTLISELSDDDIF